MLASLPQKEIDRQEVINGKEPGVSRPPPPAPREAQGTSPSPPASRAELFATEGSHLRILRVLDLLFYQRMRKESLLSREELALLFPNLPDVIEIHSEPPPSRLPLSPAGLAAPSCLTSPPSRFPVALQSLLNSGICQRPPLGCPSVTSLCVA